MGHTAGRRPAGPARAREHQAYELRIAGYTYDQIADTLGYANRGAAHKAVTRILDRRWTETSEQRVELKRVMLDRIERMVRSLWPRVLQGDQFAIDRAVKLLERQARLVGLDAPVTVAVTDDSRNRVQVLIERLRELPAPLGNGDEPHPNGDDPPPVIDVDSIEL